MGKMQQEILCIKSTTLFKKGKWNGLKTTDLDYYYNLLLKSSEFKVREGLETNPEYKQVIPQVILKYKETYFLHKQVNAGEKRLNSLCPLPLGGHVEKFDLNTKESDMLQTALLRELSEEAEVHANIKNKIFKGIIYLEDENPVNHVHIGLMYVFELDNNDVKTREEGLQTVGWVNKEYLIEHLDELTYWSKIFVKECL